MQTRFKGCVGVRSGPKGPVIDLSIVGLESLSKQNLGFALGYVQSEPQGPVIHSSICGGAPGRLGIALVSLAVVTDPGRVPILVQTEFKVCTVVHSRPKGPVIDITISFCG